MPAEQEKRIAKAGQAVSGNIAYFARHLGKVESRWKADKTRVTNADIAVSDAITGWLAENFPNDDVVSEEVLPSAESGGRSLKSRFCWVLDPIDGTNNYALGLPACGIMLALLEEGVPVYGWIYEHLSGGLVEGGARRGIRVNGTPIQAQRASGVFDKQAIVSLSLPLSERYLKCLSPLLTRNPARCFGSAATNLTYTALSVFDGSFSMRCKVWDISAGHALLAGAGRQIVYLEAQPFPLRELTASPPNFPFLAGTEAFLRFTVPLFSEKQG
ncbi:MAG: inositol monophosphatase [Puniceicoccales bacterium]|jgi:myo-inositol-1(or 4)-monophosphatase|nr:inositol monophosphatase [Puniceicoccales bacterium]